MFYLPPSYERRKLIAAQGVITKERSDRVRYARRVTHVTAGTRIAHVALLFKNSRNIKRWRRDLFHDVVYRARLMT